MPLMNRRQFAASAVALALTCSTASAVIQALTPLQSQTILLATVDRVDPDRPAMVLTVKETFKGKSPAETLPINLTGDKEKHTPKLLKRVAKDVPVIVFVHTKGKEHMGLAFTNGTWFQVLGTTDGQTTRWAFTHCETYLRRTFKGTTDELQTVVKDVLAGKAKAPPPDTKVPPGFGPEIEAKPTP